VLLPNRVYALPDIEARASPAVRPYLSRAARLTPAALRGTTRATLPTEPSMSLGLRRNAPPSTTPLSASEG
jgi:hypothetical protein